MTMTITAIDKKAAEEAAKYSAAKQIRELLDAAIKAAGNEEIEQEILDLVTGDDE